MNGSSDSSRLGFALAVSALVIAICALGLSTTAARASRVAMPDPAAHPFSPTLGRSKLEPGGRLQVHGLNIILGVTAFHPVDPVTASITCTHCRRTKGTKVRSQLEPATAMLVLVVHLSHPIVLSLHRSVLKITLTTSESSETAGYRIVRKHEPGGIEYELRQVSGPRPRR